MGLTGLIAFLAMAALVAPLGEGRVMDALVVCGVALTALTALATSREHRTYRAAVTRHWAAAALFAGFVGWILVQAWSAPDAALAEARGRLSLLVIAALGLAALTTAAAALRQGASEAIGTILGFGVAAGAATLLLATLSDAGLVAPTGLAALSVLAVFAGLEGYRRAQRSVTHTGEPPPVARRVFLPGAALTACAVGIAAAQDLSALLAAAVGVIALGGVAFARARPGERGIVLAFAGGAAGAGLVLFGLVRLLTGAGAPLPEGLAMGSTLALWEQSPWTGIGLDALGPALGEGQTSAAAQLLAETGLIGAVLALAAAIAGVLVIVLTPDRDRRPSRAGALCSGLVACLVTSALTSPALTHAAPALTFACLLGLSAAYGDRKRLSSAAGHPQSEPAPVGMQRL